MREHRLVITLGRPFDVTLNGVTDWPGVRKITIPFATAEGAWMAMAEMKINIEHSGGDGAHQVIQGEVVHDHDQ